MCYTPVALVVVDSFTLEFYHYFLSDRGDNIPHPKGPSSQNI